MFQWPPKIHTTDIWKYFNFIILITSLGVWLELFFVFLKSISFAFVLLMHGWNCCNVFSTKSLSIGNRNKAPILEGFSLIGIGISYLVKNKWSLILGHPWGESGSCTYRSWSAISLFVRARRGNFYLNAYEYSFMVLWK